MVALLVLGPKRLPEVGRAVGKGMRDFKEAINGVTGDESKGEVMSAETPKPANEPADRVA